MANKPNDNGDVLPDVVLDPSVKPGDMVLVQKPFTYGKTALGVALAKALMIKGKETAMVRHFADCYGMPGEKMRKYMGVDQGIGESFTTVATGHVNNDGTVRIDDVKKVPSFPGIAHINKLRDELYSSIMVPKEMLDPQKETTMTTAKHDKGTMEVIDKAMRDWHNLVKANPMPGKKTATVWDVQMMPTYGAHAPTEQDIAKAHTVVVVQKSRELQPSTWLELTPQEVQIGRPYGLEQQTAPTEPPPAAEPSSELLEQLCEAATGCKPDGYATWEGAVGFAVMRLNEQSARIKALLLEVQRIDRNYNEERQRANRAADDEGNVRNRAKQQWEEDNRIIAALNRDVTLLRAKLRKR